jgi:hypothetical protein
MTLKNDTERGGGTGDADKCKKRCRSVSCHNDLDRVPLVGLEEVHMPLTELHYT